MANTLLKKRSCASAKLGLNQGSATLRVRCHISETLVCLQTLGRTTFEALLTPLEWMPATKSPGLI